MHAYIYIYREEERESSENPVSEISTSANEDYFLSYYCIICHKYIYTHTFLIVHSLIWCSTARHCVCVCVHARMCVRVSGWVGVLYISNQISCQLVNSFRYFFSQSSFFFFLLSFQVTVRFHKFWSLICPKETALWSEGFLKNVTDECYVSQSARGQIIMSYLVVAVVKLQWFYLHHNLGENP